MVRTPVHHSARAAFAACAFWSTFAVATLPTSPADAITRPKKEPEAKAQACPEVGEGYIRVPGSDTCVRVGGSVRVEGMAISR